MRRSIAAMGLAAVLAASGCGGGGGTTSGTSERPTTTQARATQSTPASGTHKVSANKATNAQLQEALRSAGVPNPDRWAREIEEYRPYPDNDPTLGKLRAQLEKYKPSPDVLNKIMSTLEP